jgi:hypothetical protein
MRKPLTGLAAVAMVAAVLPLLLTASATASSRQAPRVTAPRAAGLARAANQPTGTIPCLGDSFECIDMLGLGGGPPQRCGDPAFYQTTDYSGVPIYWTYANGSSQCVHVVYAPDAADSQFFCRYYFYVPNGYATAKIFFGYWEFGVKHYASLDEDPNVGWTYAFSASDGVTEIDFGDNNGQLYPKQIGWGGGPGYGFWRQCGGGQAGGLGRSRG